MNISKDNFNQALSILNNEFKVFLPIGEGDDQLYKMWDGNAKPNFDGNPTLPPKDLLFPKSESLYSVDLASKEIVEPEINEKKAVVGIRPCDVRSIENLTAAFTEKSYTDNNYVKRRENLTIISIACSSVPFPTCFCDSMGLSPTEAPGADVLLTETEDGYHIEFLTEKGNAIETMWKSLIAEGKAVKQTAPACDLKINKPADMPEKLMAKFDDDKMWAKLSEACLGCGCCTYVCPTCYCFDINNQKHGSEVTTFRCWDSCMFSDYSRMAGGHNPRPSKKERLRNRYLHKLAYFDERYGKTLCVGCGRCIAKCPSGLDITNVIEAINGGE